MYIKPNSRKAALRSGNLKVRAEKGVLTLVSQTQQDKIALQY